MMQESSAWRIIDSIMSMVALGAFAGVLLFISVSLFVGGFPILNLGYKWGAIGAWVGAGIVFMFAIFLSYLFRKAYQKQRKKEEIEDYTNMTHKLM